HSAADRLDCSDLAGTLRLIARDGADGFYSGPVSAAIEREVTGHGGIITAADLADYRPRVLREPPLAYHGHRYVTCCDQVGYEALNILSCFDLAAAGAGSAAAYHLLAEALACSFADSMTWYGDSDFEDAPVAGLASAGFGAARAAGLSAERALPRP